MMWDGSWGYGGVGAWIGMAFMMFFGLLVLAGVVLLIVWLARGAGSAGGQGSSATSATGSYSGTQAACDIAKQRYARGEITREQYEEICAVVGARP